ncbi:MAG TPA: hypothetical protein VFY48_00450 [Solirubrobacterales bacterium]|nr:hypothetical protein [Solirubrobacterales bacterium]
MSAQVLPIFLLAMMIGDARLGATSQRPPSSLWVTLLLYVLNFGTILVGEIAALISISNGGTTLLHALVCAAFAAGAAFLTLRFVIATAGDYSEHFSKPARSRQRRLANALSLLIGATTFLILFVATS